MKKVKEKGLDQKLEEEIERGFSEPKEKSDKESIDTNKKKKFILVALISAVILIISVIGVILFVFFNSGDDTYKIAEKIVEKIELNYSGISLEEREMDDEFEYSYIHATLIFIDSIGTTDDDVAIAVARYNSNYEAQKKADFFDGLNKIGHEKLDKTVVAEFDDYDDIFNKNTIIVKGKYLISINSKVNSQVRLKDDIDDIMKKFNIKDEGKVYKAEVDTYWNDEITKHSSKYDKLLEETIKAVKDEIVKEIETMNGCTGSDCDDKLNEILYFKKYEVFSGEMTSAQNKYNEIIKAKEDVVSTINSSVAKVQKSLNQSEYDAVKKKINELTDSYYDSYKANWNKQLSTVEEKVFKKGCGKYKWKDLLRNPDNYKGKNAYFFGQVLQKVDSTRYLIGVTCTKYQYIDGYNCENNIYVTYYGDTRLIEDDLVYMWGTMNGTYSYVTVRGDEVTIPSLSAKYISLK